MPTAPSDSRPERADLEKLADELSARGCKTVLVSGDDRRPQLDVINPSTPRRSERIYAHAGHFWNTRAVAIASRDEPAAAAQAIARTLSPPGGNR